MMTSEPNRETPEKINGHQPRILVDAIALRDLVFQAGLSARDFNEILPFNSMTMHNFLTQRTETKREGTLYWYAQIEKFLTQALAKKVLPIPSESKIYRMRKEFIKASYEYWFRHNESLQGFIFSSTS